jgi:hypothetical protein
MEQLPPVSPIYTDISVTTAWSGRRTPACADESVVSRARYPEVKYIWGRLYSVVFASIVKAALGIVR